METLELFTLIKDIILIAGSITATFFTFKGFNKWKREHIGKIKYDLSRNLLKSVYNLRDDFQTVRSPFIRASEFSPDHNIIETKESEKNLYVIQNRLKYLQASYNNFLSLLPEVEIEFDSELYKLCIEITRHISNYNFKLNEYIQLVDTWDLVKNPFHQELNSVIYNNGEENKTSANFNKTVDSIKTRLMLEIKKY